MMTNAKDVPDLHPARDHHHREHRVYERLAAVDRGQQPRPVHPVRQHSADGRGQQVRQGAEAQRKHREKRRARHVVGQPADHDLLKPLDPAAEQNRGPVVPEAAESKRVQRMDAQTAPADDAAESAPS